MAVLAIALGCDDGSKCAEGGCVEATGAALSASAGPAQEPVVSEVHRLTADPLLAPRFSPDGRHVLAAGAKFQGLWVLPAAGGTPRGIADDPHLGWTARWDGADVVAGTRDGREVRVEDAAGTARRTVTGRAFDTARRAGDAEARIVDDRVIVRQGGADRVIAEGNDRYYAVAVSPDGTLAAIEGLATGLHVVDLATGARTFVARGNHPAWRPDSSGFLFDVTADDGVDLVAGDLWSWDRRDGRATRLTDTPDRIETRPAIAPDGRTVAWQDRDGLWAGTLPEGDPARARQQ